MLQLGSDASLVGYIFLFGTSPSSSSEALPWNVRGFNRPTFAPLGSWGSSFW